MMFVTNSVKLWIWAGFLWFPPRAKSGGREACSHSTWCRFVSFVDEPGRHPSGPPLRVGEGFDKYSSWPVRMWCGHKNKKEGSPVLMTRFQNQTCAWMKVSVIIMLTVILRSSRKPPPMGKSLALNRPSFPHLNSLSHLCLFFSAFQ